LSLLKYHTVKKAIFLVLCSESIFCDSLDFPLPHRLVKRNHISVRYYQICSPLTTHDDDDDGDGATNDVNDVNDDGDGTTGEDNDEDGNGTMGMESTMMVWAQRAMTTMTTMMMATALGDRMRQQGW